MQLNPMPGARPAPPRGLSLPARVVLWMACSALAVALAAALWPQTAAAQAPAGGAPWPTIALRKVADDYTRPVYVAGAGDDSGRLFVVEKAGYITIIRNGEKLPTPFLDIFSKVKSSCSECGLLSIAFPPDFAEQGYFFVSYTARGNPAPPVLPDEPSPDDGNDNVIARYRVLPEDPNRADPDSEERILLINQPYGNHNGGLILFGPDDNLYVGIGDGGQGGDPLDAAQNLASPLGKILRIEVGASGAYTVPADNPFLNPIGAIEPRPEIWAYGVRNPWRFSFDTATGDFWMGDVGQSTWEEVDYVPADQAGGQNFGWNTTEATHCYPPTEGTCDTTGITLPIHEYGRDVGQSITGGLVYHGVYTPLQGVYVYGDFGSGLIFGLRKAGAAWENHLLLESNLSIASLGVGQAGELYVVDYGGAIYLLTVPDFDFPHHQYLPLLLRPE